MKLTFKDLKQQKFIIEAEPSETIAQLKEKISSEKGWEPQTQKLIFSGKILQDENTIESYSIEEKGFIVCMTTKVGSSSAIENHVIKDLLILHSPKSSHQNPRNRQLLRSLSRPLQCQRLLRNLQHPQRHNHLPRLRQRLAQQPRLVELSTTQMPWLSVISAMLLSQTWRRWVFRVIKSTEPCVLLSSTRTVL
jgi:UV excision repair protein RAD23